MAGKTCKYEKGKVAVVLMVALRFCQSKETVPADNRPFFCFLTLTWGRGQHTFASEDKKLLLIFINFSAPPLLFYFGENRY